MLAMADVLEGRRDHYLELALKVRAIAREARFPAATRALVENAKRFDQRAKTTDPFYGHNGGDNEGYSGPAMTLGNAAAPRVRLIVWCLDCRHQVEPDPSEMTLTLRASEPIVTDPGCPKRQVGFERRRR